MILQFDFRYIFKKMFPREKNGLGYAGTVLANVGQDVFLENTLVKKYER